VKDRIERLRDGLVACVRSDCVVVAVSHPGASVCTFWYGPDFVLRTQEEALSVARTLAASWWANGAIEYLRGLQVHIVQSLAAGRLGSLCANDEKKIARILAVADEPQPPTLGEAVAALLRKWEADETGSINVLDGEMNELADAVAREKEAKKC